MKSKEIEVLTRNGKELTNILINTGLDTEEHKIASEKFKFLMKLMDELTKVE